MGSFKRSKKREDFESRASGQDYDFENYLWWSNAVTRVIIGLMGVCRNKHSLRKVAKV